MTPIKVALFATCLGDQFFADACADAVRLLRRFGAEVDFPEGQTCCGQPAWNSGHRRDAERMVRHTIDVLRDADRVVLPSGSCAGMIRSFYEELGPDGGRELAARTFELCQFLVHELGVTKIGTGLDGFTVAYHHGCHALRELGVDDEPLALLRSSGATVVEWVADRECCGFGGLFSAKMPEVSVAMADRKLDTLPDVDFVTSSDGGCLLQLAGRAARRPTAPTFAHVASLLWRGASA